MSIFADWIERIYGEEIAREFPDCSVAVNDIFVIGDLYGDEAFVVDAIEDRCPYATAPQGYEAYGVDAPYARIWWEARNDWSTLG